MRRVYTETKFIGGYQGTWRARVVLDAWHYGEAFARSEADAIRKAEGAARDRYAPFWAHRNRHTIVTCVVTPPAEPKWGSRNWKYHVDIMRSDGKAVTGEGVDVRFAVMNASNKF